jgi:hypothetical protein
MLTPIMGVPAPTDDLGAVVARVRATFDAGITQMLFRGVGGSGMGAYHGQTGFDTFSHLRSVYSRATWFDPPVIYPPVSSFKCRLMRRFL